MKLGYFPGCSLHATAREMDESLKAIAAPLDLELEEVRDWSCCGASSAHATNHTLGVALAARNLALAEAQGLARVAAPCAACFSRLAAARHELGGADAAGGLAKQVTEAIGRPFANTVEVLNGVALLREKLEAIRAKATGALKGLKVACYYGCLLVRPAEVAQYDDPEQPVSMEEVVEATGATAVKWNKRLECCGGGFSIARTGSVVRLGRSIVEDARAAGADAIVVSCPMCHSNLDMRQGAMAARGEKPLPILYLTQLVGLALKLEPDALGLQRHFVSTAPLLARQPDAATPAAKA